jgi:hypothetical protein
MTGKGQVNKAASHKAASTIGHPVGRTNPSEFPSLSAIAATKLRKQPSNKGTFKFHCIWMIMY